MITTSAESILCNGPIWDDVATLSGLNLNRSIDIIFGGFPCQDISIAGHGKGLAGERSGLFFEILRLAKESKPQFLFLENVPAITYRGGIEVVREITEVGYDCRWCVISAASVGACHRRERWFLLANAQGERLQATGQPLRAKEKLTIHNNQAQYGAWGEEPENKLVLAGVDDGDACRAHRIRALGNAVVPEQAKEAFKILMGLT